MDPVPEIRREKVFLKPGMTTEDEADPILQGRKRIWSPEWGWMYV